MKQPDFLKLSPEKIAENEQQDANIRRKMNTRLKMSATEFERGRAIATEQAQRDAVKKLTSVVSLARQVSSDGLGVSITADLGGAQEQLDVSKRQLAESLAEQGKFLEAAKTTPDADETAEYKKIAKAVSAKRAKYCLCDAPQGQVGAELLTVPKYRIVRKIYSVKEAAELNLLACVVCGEYVVGELPVELQRIKNAIADATTEKAVSDLDLLKS